MEQSSRPAVFCYCMHHSEHKEKEKKEITVWRDQTEDHISELQQSQVHLQHVIKKFKACGCTFKFVPAEHLTRCMHPQSLQHTVIASCIGWCAFTSEFVEVMSSCQWHHLSLSLSLSLRASSTGLAVFNTKKVAFYLFIFFLPVLWLQSYFY